MRLTKAALIALTTLTPIAAFADSDSPQEMALEARKGYFLMLGANMAPLAAMAKGEMEYDEAKAAQAAANIETLTNYPVGMHFMDGTSMDDMEDSEAKPEIWLDNEGFAAKFNGLVEAAKGASEAVKGGQANVGPVLQKIGGACKGCHDDFRKEDS